MAYGDQFTIFISFKGNSLTGKNPGERFTLISLFSNAVDIAIAVSGSLEYK